MQRRKGQTIIFEQVLLFVVGVAIFITTYAFFYMYQNLYSTTTTLDNLERLKESLISSLVTTAKYNTNSSYIMEIPERIGERPYTITLTNEGLEITLADSSVSSFSSLLGLNETYTFSGSVESLKRKVVIRKQGNAITIR